MFVENERAHNTFNGIANKERFFPRKSRKDQLQFYPILYGLDWAIEQRV